jgi:hypothetical protein
MSFCEVQCPVCRETFIKNGKRQVMYISRPEGARIFPCTDTDTHHWNVRVCPLCAGSGYVSQELYAAYVLKTGSGLFEDALTYEQVVELRALFG